MTVYDLIEQRRRSLARVDAAISEMTKVLDGMSSTATTRYLVVIGLKRLHEKRRLLLSREEASPVPVRHLPQIISTTGSDRDWRFDFQRMHELETGFVSGPRAISAYAIEFVVGHSQFDAARAPAQAPKESTSNQNVDVVHHRVFGPKAHVDADFFIRWRDAMRLEMGPDEYEKFVLARRERLHREPPTHWIQGSAEGEIQDEPAA